MPYNQTSIPQVHLYLGYCYQPHPMTTTSQPYGERLICEGELITFPNPRPGRHYWIRITLPEFTCKCPFSGYPDFATIYLDYIPAQQVVELKSIKLYINGYRDKQIAHEAAANQILDDFVAAAQPVAVCLKADFNPRGNVHTVVEVVYPDSPMGQLPHQRLHLGAGQGPGEEKTLGITTIQGL